MAATPLPHEHIHFPQADDLLRALAPLPILDTETANPEFLFRGHASESWQLIPAALRREPESGPTAAVVRVAGQDQFNGTEDVQVWAEFHLLLSFVKSCDRAVISLPGDGFEFRKIWMDDQLGKVSTMYRIPDQWPNPSHLPLLAFAQGVALMLRS